MMMMIQQKNNYDIGICNEKIDCEFSTSSKWWWLVKFQFDANSKDDFSSNICEIALFSAEIK